MSTATDLHAKIAAALTGLIKQIKALRYYPPHHPALQAAAEESLNGFRPLLQERPLSLAVRKDAFLLDDQPLGKASQVLGHLAMFCFARRIQQLTILPDLSAADLDSFVRSLTLDPQEIVARGGIQAILEQARVTTIWVNEQDLEVILARKQRLEELPSEAPGGSAEGKPVPTSLPPAQLQSQELKKLIKLLEQAKDDLRFRALLQELVPLVRLNLVHEHQRLVLRAMALLCRNATDPHASELRSAHAMNAIGQLATDEMTDYLATCLLDSDATDKVRKLLTNILVFLGDKVVRRLMQLLAEEDVAANRKLLAEVLMGIGPAAVPILQEHLFDERWYVVRNAVTILGELRSQESLPHLTPLLEHREVRVRRETIRTLSRIGGPRAVSILLQATEADDQETRRQALLSLGAIRAASAIPTLLKLLEQPDWSQRTIDIKKDAIRALGEIRSSEAVAPLATLLGKRRLWRRARHDELRVIAAAALGEIADATARSALDQACHDRSAVVARAAAQALMHLEKEHS